MKTMIHCLHILMFLTLTICSLIAADFSGTTPGPFWATLISPTQYVSSLHYTAGPGSSFTFRSGDSASVVGYRQEQQSDTVVGTLNSTPSGARYGIGYVVPGDTVLVVTQSGIHTGLVTWVGWRYTEPSFQHNAPVRGGDSGGPTFDLSGNLVGTHHYSCGNSCGLDVHLGRLFGLLDPRPPIPPAPTPPPPPPAPPITILKREPYVWEAKDWEAMIP
jgi:hypothetical protein